MTETDYILASNLARIRAAQEIMRTCLTMSGGHDADYGIKRDDAVTVLRQLSAIEDRLEKMIEIDRSRPTKP